MAAKSSAYSTVHNGIKKGTSIGRNPKKVSSMNKSKRKGRSRKQLRNRGQGK